MYRPTRFFERSKCYATCRAVLQRELAVEPVAETQALAKTIERSRGVLRPRAKVDIPIEVLRPPTLVGRERA